MTDPLVGSYIRSMSRKSVDLPLPEGPTTPMLSPGATRKETPLRISRPSP